jgi:ribosomal protein L35
MAQIETKYNCEACNYKCIYPAHWKQHIESEKHKNNGIRKTRSDKVLEPKCKHCEYTTNNLTCMKVHCLTQHSSKEERKKEFKYFCDKCDFGTYADILFTRHCETQKHTQQNQHLSPAK